MQHASPPLELMCHGIPQCYLPIKATPEGCKAELVGLVTY